MLLNLLEFLYLYVFNIYLVIKKLFNNITLLILRKVRLVNLTLQPHINISKNFIINTKKI